MDADSALPHVVLPRMSSAAHSCSNISHAQRAVQRLRAEASIERITVPDRTWVQFCLNRPRVSQPSRNRPASHDRCRDLQLKHTLLVPEGNSSSPLQRDAAFHQLSDVVISWKSTCCYRCVTPMQTEPNPGSDGSRKG
ncbi:guanine nucleotide-binding protein G(I)/G(S)/G(O) subunit gamma-12a isoform X3 [Nothobranchius furzeri]|uniref:guanine nucleotide-binding protein G(I)/G(S)/G(O) subunit gamma-12a isoform X3 n=1 Tax=Nothobranchius furzeri TaxID=105023 RepID=UPI003904B168